MAATPVPTPFMDFLIEVLRGTEIAKGLDLYRDVMRVGLPAVLAQPPAMDFLRDTHNTWTEFVMWAMDLGGTDTEDMTAFFQMHLVDDSDIAARMVAAKPGVDEAWAIIYPSPSRMGQLQT